MHLFSDELAKNENIRDEVDLGIELPVVCELANEFLRSIPLPDEQAAEVDETLAILLRSSSPSLKVEVAERLAHVDEGPRRTVRLLAHDRTPDVAVPVLRYSPLLSEGELAAIARLRSDRVPSEEHLIAIAWRFGLSSRLTDILTTRGTPRVLDVVAENRSAKVTMLGLCRLAMRSRLNSNHGQDG